MISAGIEGGSKGRIEAEWDMADVEAQRSFWTRYGPPSNVMLVLIGKALGFDVTKPAAPTFEPLPVDGPSIAEMAMTASPLVH